MVRRMRDRSATPSGLGFSIWSTETRRALRDAGLCSATPSGSHPFNYVSRGELGQSTAMHQATALRRARGTSLAPDSSAADGGPRLEDVDFDLGPFGKGGVLVQHDFAAFDSSTQNHDAAPLSNHFTPDWITIGSVKKAQFKAMRIRRGSLRDPQAPFEPIEAGASGSGVPRVDPRNEFQSSPARPWQDGRWRELFGARR